MPRVVCFVIGDELDVARCHPERGETMRDIWGGYVLMVKNSFDYSISPTRRWVARFFLLVTTWMLVLVFAAVVAAVAGCSAQDAPRQAVDEPTPSVSTGWQTSGSTTTVLDDPGDQGIETGQLGTPYRYSNGVEMTVKVEKAATTSWDREFGSVKKGKKYIAVIMTIRNGSARHVDPSLTVPFVYYGDQNLPAEIVSVGEYDSIGITVLRPGKSATGGYTFEVPSSTKTLMIEAYPGMESETGTYYSTIIFDAKV